MGWVKGSHPRLASPLSTLRSYSPNRIHVQTCYIFFQRVHGEARKAVCACGVCVCVCVFAMTACGADVSLCGPTGVCAHVRGGGLCDNS